VKKEKNRAAVSGRNVLRRAVSAKLFVLFEVRTRDRSASRERFV